LYTLKLCKISPVDQDKQKWIAILFGNAVKIMEIDMDVRNRSATEPVTLKVCNVKLSFDIWLVLYMYFILYS